MSSDRALAKHKTGLPMPACATVVALTRAYHVVRPSRCFNGTHAPCPGSKFSAGRASHAKPAPRDLISVRLPSRKRSCHSLLPIRTERYRNLVPFPFPAAGCSQQPHRAPVRDRFPARPERLHLHQQVPSCDGRAGGRAERAVQAGGAVPPHAPRPTAGAGWRLPCAGQLGRQEGWVASSGSPLYCRSFDGLACPV